MKIHNGNNSESVETDLPYENREKSPEAKSILTEDDLEISDNESQHLLNESKRFIKNISNKRITSSAQDNDEMKPVSSDSNDSDEECYIYFKRQSVNQDEDSSSSSDEDYLPVDTSETKSSSGSSAEEDLPEELPSAETKAIMTASKDFIRDEVMQRRRSSLRQKEKRQEHTGILLEKLEDIAEGLSEDDFQTSDVDEMSPDEKLYKKFRAKLIVTDDVETNEKYSDGDSSDEDFCPIKYKNSHETYSSDEQMEISDEENLDKEQELSSSATVI